MTLTRVMHTRDDHIYVHLAKSDFVFMMPAKTASSSMKQALRVTQGYRNLRAPLNYKSRAETLEYKHRVGVVRHPLRRLESCWADKFILRHTCTRLRFLADLEHFGMYQGMSFADFVLRVCEIPDEEADGDGKHFRSLAFDLHYEGQYLPTHLLRFETIGEDWETLRGLVLRKSGVRLKELPHLRKSNRARAAWTEEARVAAVRRYAQDFELFGYKS